VKTLVYYYSNSGNNEFLAKKLAARLGADLERVAFPRLEMGSAAMAAFTPFHPRVPNTLLDLDYYDHVVFVSPVWIGRLAKPMRVILRKNRDAFKSFSVFSFSGGALGPNDKVLEDVKRITGREPLHFEQFLINDLLSDSQKGSMDETSAYTLDDEGFESIEAQVEGFCRNLAA
jgi:menaquinone-dependent protoporphyrinogen IX oxidase